MSALSFFAKIISLFPKLLETIFSALNSHFYYLLISLRISRAGNSRRFFFALFFSYFISLGWELNNSNSFAANTSRGKAAMKENEQKEKGKPIRLKFQWGTSQRFFPFSHFPDLFPSFPWASNFRRSRWQKLSSGLFRQE